MDKNLDCALCESHLGDVLCSCDEQFCENCFTKRHLKRRPNHHRKDISDTRGTWSLTQGGNRSHSIEVSRIEATPKLYKVTNAIRYDKNEMSLTTPPKEPQPSTGERPRSIQEQFVDAARDGKLDLVKDLLQSGASVHTKHAGWTALGRAAKEGHEAVVKFLVEKGSDLDTEMDVGWGILPGGGSALTWAAGRGHLKIVKYLVAHGAKLDILTNKPVFFGTGGTGVTMAAGRGELDVVKFLLEAGADRGNKDGTPGWDAFLYACDQGQFSVVVYFVETKKFNIHRTNGKGQTPIFAAALGGRHKVMEYLVGKGASINIQDTDGDGLLHHVATKGQKKTAVWLRRRGANLRAANKAGKTPLDIATEKARETEGDTYAPLVETLDWNKPGPTSDDSEGCILM